MRKSYIIKQILMMPVIFSMALACGRKTDPDRELKISSPSPDALFPPEFPAPAFEWWSLKQDPSDRYDVKLFTENNKLAYSVTVDQPSWTPACGTLRRR